MRRDVGLRRDLRNEMVSPEEFGDQGEKRKIRKVKHLSGGGRVRTPRFLGVDHPLRRRDTTSPTTHSLLRDHTPSMKWRDTETQEETVSPFYYRG